MADSPRQFTFLCGRQRAIADGLSRLVEGELQGPDSRPSEGGTSSRSGTQAAADVVNVNPQHAYMLA